MYSIDRKKHRFVVGVDFGMTTTSVAFGRSFSNDIHLVQSWPNNRSQYPWAGNVPSLVQYTDPKIRAKLWGFEVNPGSPGALRWFKPLLQQQPKSTESQQPGIHPEDTPGTASARPLEYLFNGLSVSENVSNIPAFIAPRVYETAQTLQKLQISPVTVVTDYLQSIRETTIFDMERSVSVPVLHDTNVEYVLTIPATWSESAKELLVQAAEGAGFGLHRESFHLISEPECAAVHTLNVMQPNNLKTGDTFIVCNAGSWTVDTNSYRILKMEPLKLDEIASGTSALCGSVYLDQAFERHIRGVLGDMAIDNMKPLWKSRMMRSWEEEVKFIFPNTEEEYLYEVAVPGARDNEEANVEDGYHTMKRNVIQEIFDPIMDEIIDLVEHQVIGLRHMGEPVAALLLVGELGSSKYLRKRLQNTQFGWRLTSLQVLQPKDSRTAAVRGAVFRGLDGSIKKICRARRSFGRKSTIILPQDCNSIPNTWPSNYEDYKYWDSEANTWMLTGHMDWFIVKGVSEMEPVLIDLYHIVPIPARPSDFIIITVLYACDLLVAPEFKWEHPGAVFKMCTVRSDLSSIPPSKFKKTTNARGESCYELKPTLRLSILEDALKLETSIDGMACGEVIARFV